MSVKWQKTGASDRCGTAHRACERPLKGRFSQDLQEVIDLSAGLRQ